MRTHHRLLPKRGAANDPVGRKMAAGKCGR